MNSYWRGDSDMLFLYWSEVDPTEFDFQMSFNAYWRRKNRIPPPSKPIYFGGTVSANPTRTAFVASFDEDEFHGSQEECMEYLERLRKTGQFLGLQRF